MFKKSFTLFLSTLALSACSHSTPAPDGTAPTEAQQTAKVEDCLTSPLLSASWGECNVQKTVYDAMPKFQGCVQKAKTGSYPADGEIDFGLKLYASGKVKSAKLVQGRTKNKKLNICLQKVMKKLQFAPPPEGTKPELTVPLNFSNLK
jgi:hypothetical protein